MKKTSKLMAMVVVAALTGAAAGCGAPEGASVEIKAGPLLCFLSNDEDIVLAEVTCTVWVSNAQASAEGVKVSVTEMLRGVFADICPGFGPGEQKLKTFSAAAEKGLQREYDRARSDWVVETVQCK